MENDGCTYYELRLDGVSMGLNNIIMVTAAYHG